MLTISWIKKNHLFTIILTSIKSFFKHNCLSISAAISFYFIFSFVPLLLLFLTIIGFILGANELLIERIILFLKLNIPFLSDDMLTALKGFFVNWSSYGWIWIIILIWIGESFMVELQNAMNHIFGRPQDKRFIMMLKQRILGWGLFFIWCGVVIISVGITALAEIIHSHNIVVFGVALSDYLEMGITVKYILPFMLMVITVTFVFKMIAGVYVDLRHAIQGAIIFSLLWETAKYVFAWYIKNVTTFNLIYGSISTLMISLLWIYYSVALFLFSS